MAEHPDIIEQGRGRLSRSSPRPAPAPPRRTVIAIVAGTAAAVLIASSVVAAVRPWAVRASLSDPCTLLPAAAVARLVPAGTGGAPGVLTSRIATTEMCSWLTTSGTLLSLNVEYMSSTGLAQQQFSAMPDATGPVLAAAITSVPGIGDQAQAVIDTGSPGQVAVYVRVLSGSTLLAIGYNSAGMDSPGIGLGPLPRDEAILARLVVAARAALSHLGSR